MEGAELLQGCQRAEELPQANYIISGNTVQMLSYTDCTDCFSALYRNCSVYIHFLIVTFLICFRRLVRSQELENVWQTK